MIDPDQAVAPATAYGSVAVRGAAFLAGRTAAVQGLQVASALVLAHAIQPGSYAVFAVAAGVTGAARYLGDFGIANLLIARAGASERELRESAFIGLTAALSTGLLVIAIAGLVSSARSGFAELPLVAVVLSVTLLTDSLRLGPMVRLSTRLDFGRLAAIALAEAVVLYTTQIALLIAGAGLWALVLAQVARSLTGTAFMHQLGGGIARPRRPASVRALLRASLPYQATATVVSASGLLFPVIVAFTLTSRDVGLWAWSTVLATPLLALMQLVQSVSFPTFSRVRADGRAVDDAAELVGRIAALASALAAGVLAGFASDIVPLVFGERWAEATRAVQIALVGLVALSLGFVLSSVIDSDQRPLVRTRAAVAGCFATLVTIVPLTAAFGLSGAAAATALIGPVVDTVLLARAARIRLTRALLNAAAVLGVSLAAAGAVSQVVTDVPELLLLGAATAVGCAAFACACDLTVVRAFLTRLRAARGPGVSPAGGC
jgi:teichuronic acid exporter